MKDLFLRDGSAINPHYKKDTKFGGLSVTILQTSKNGVRFQTLQFGQFIPNQEPPQSYQEIQLQYLAAEAFLWTPQQLLLHLIIHAMFLDIM